jgi:hypothetical protein
MNTRVERHGSRFRSAESVDCQKEVAGLLCDEDLHFCKDKQRHVLSLVESLSNSRKSGLAGKPRGRPKSSNLDDSLKEKVLKIRRRYDWGPNKIAGHLKHKV